MIKGITYDVQPGVLYDLPRGVKYDLVRGVTYDEDLHKTTEALNQEKNQFEQFDQNSKIENPVVGADIVTMRGLVIAENLNFTLKLLRRICKICDTEAGEEKTFFYQMQVNVISLKGAIRVFEGIVAAEKVKSFDWLKKITLSLATVPQNKEEKAEFLKKIQIALEDESALTEIQYPNAGWRKVPELGWRYIYADGYIGGANELIHAPQRKYELNLNREWLGKNANFQSAMAMCDICKSGRASMALFLFVHTTLLTELFEQAGEALNFTFGVLGVTNSRKTSLVTTMAKVFDRSKLIADAEFATATDCGIEKTLSLYKDAPVLIDDFKPGANKSQQNVLNSKLDNVLRLYGNRVTKKRMVDFMADGDKKYFPIGGGCVITLEVLDAVLSSVSRLFVVEIGADEVLNDRLQFFQDNRWILPNHVYDFLEWITPNFEKTVQFIQLNFPKERDKKVFAFPRYREMFGTLMTTAKIIATYAINRGFWQEQEKNQWLSRCENCIETELYAMGEKWQGCDKGMIVISAFLEALRTGKVVPVLLTANTCSDRQMVYEDETRFFVRTKYLKLLTNEYCKRFGESQQIINETELIGLLERKQILEVLEKNGTSESSRKLPMQKGNTLRYLYILKEKIRKFEQL